MYIAAEQTSASECAKRMGMSQGTFYSRMQNTGTFTLSEIGLLRQVLGIPQGEIIEAIGNKISA